MLRRGGGLTLHVLSIQAHKINWVEHQRRKSAVTNGSGNNLASEREQQPRAFDHDQRVKIFLRDVLDPEHARIGELETEHQLAGMFSLAFDLKHHFIFVLAILLAPTLI